jgi:hypothetical protein
MGAALAVLAACGVENAATRATDAGMSTQGLDQKTCVLTCFSHNQDRSYYPVGDDIFVMGFIRVPGTYAHGICQPEGFGAADISGDAGLKHKCTEGLPAACANDSCWPGGATHEFEDSDDPEL